MSPNIVDVEVVKTEEQAPRLLPPIPMSIVCPTCREETGFTKEDILNTFLAGDICCPNCNNVIYSVTPEIRPVWSGTSSSGTHYGDYDYD